MKSLNAGPDGVFECLARRRVFRCVCTDVHLDAKQFVVSPLRLPTLSRNRHSMIPGVFPAKQYWTVLLRSIHQLQGHQSVHD